MSNLQATRFFLLFSLFTPHGPWNPGALCAIVVLPLLLVSGITDPANSNSSLSKEKLFLLLSDLPVELLVPPLLHTQPFTEDKKQKYPETASGSANQRPNHLPGMKGGEKYREHDVSLCFHRLSCHQSA